MFETIKDSRYMQYVGALTASMSVTICGMYITWPSPTMPLLKSPQSPLGRPITVEEGSWIVSLLLLSPILATLLISWTIERYGRRFALLLSAFPMFAGWIIIIFGESVVMLYVARFTAGMGVGFCNTASSMYIGEIAEKDIRGKLGTAFNLMKLMGYIIVLSVGPFVSYTSLGWICASVPIVFLLVFYQMPESPYFLIKTGRKGEARANLIRLSSRRVTQDTINKKMLEIEEIVDNDMKNKATWSVLFHPKFRMSFFIILGIKSLQQFSGLVAIDAYMQTIIEASDSGLTSETSSILYGIIQVPAVLLAAAVVDKVGRKPILIISAIGCAIALIGEGYYFYLQDNLNADVSELSWLPATALIVFAVMNNFGLCTLPYILLGELFATNIKEIACSLAICYGGVIAFIVSKFFEPLSVAWGRYTMFWIFAGSCGLGAFFVFFMVPETKGKSFDEIQEKLNGKKRKEAEGVKV